MGELHLEIIGERIKSEYKIDVDLSCPQISYKEGLISEAKESHRLDLKIGNLLLIILLFLYNRYIWIVSRVMLEHWLYLI